MNQKRKAVVLRYNAQKEDSPRVVAKGEAKTAERIISLAKESGVPIKEDRDLVEMLSQIELDSQIPPKLYQAVAEVFVWLHRITDDERKNRPSSPEGGDESSGLDQ